MFVVFQLWREQEVYHSSHSTFEGAYSIANYLRKNGVKAVCRAYRESATGGTECYRPTEYGGQTFRVG